MLHPLQRSCAKREGVKSSTEHAWVLQVCIEVQWKITLCHVFRMNLFLPSEETSSSNSQVDWLWIKINLLYVKWQELKVFLQKTFFQKGKKFVLCSWFCLEDWLLFRYTGTKAKNDLLRNPYHYNLPSSCQIHLKANCRQEIIVASLDYADMVIQHRNELCTSMTNENLSALILTYSIKRLRKPQHVD